MEAVASNSNGYELMMVEGYFENRFVGPPVSQSAAQIQRARNSRQLEIKVELIDLDRRRRRDVAGFVVVQVMMMLFRRRIVMRLLQARQDLATRRLKLNSSQWTTAATAAVILVWNLVRVRYGRIQKVRIHNEM